MALLFNYASIYHMTFFLLTSLEGLNPNLQLIWFKKDTSCCMLGIVETKLAGLLLILLT